MVSLNYFMGILDTVDVYNKHQQIFAKNYLRFIKKITERMQNKSISCHIAEQTISILCINKEILKIIDCHFRLRLTNINFVTKISRLNVQISNNLVNEFRVKATLYAINIECNRDLSK